MSDVVRDAIALDGRRLAVKIRDLWDEGRGGSRGAEAQPGVGRVVEGRRVGESRRSQRSEGGATVSPYQR